MVFYLGGKLSLNQQLYKLVVKPESSTSLQSDPKIPTIKMIRILTAGYIKWPLFIRKDVMDVKRNSFIVRLIAPPTE